jgi:hypothetical protein
MDPEQQIDRLYAGPLDEFVQQRDDLARELNRAGDREAAARIKALRKPTVGAWALNQAVRRRRAETDALLATGRRLREAHEALLTGGDPAVLREAMEEERSLTSALADCAEAIASETGKSGPALRDRVRSTLHAATVDEEARGELAAGRFVREREALGLGSFGAGPAEAGEAAPKTGRASTSRVPAKPRRERAKSSGSGGRAAPAETAPGEPGESAPAKRASSRRAPAEPTPDPRFAEAERALAEARDALASAEADHAATLSLTESARDALNDAEVAEREARRVVRELWREVAKQERRLERLGPGP